MRGVTKTPRARRKSKENKIFFRMTVRISMEAHQILLMLEEQEPSQNPGALLSEALVEKHGKRFREYLNNADKSGSS